MGSNHRNRSIQPSLPLSRNTFWLFLIPLPSSDTCSISASSFSHTEDTFLLKLPLPQGKGKVLSHCSPTHVETLLFCRGALQLVPQPKTLAWRNILENQIILVERTNSTAFKKTPTRTTPPTKTSPIWPAACSRMQTFTSEPDRGWNTTRKHLQEEFFVTIFYECFSSSNIIELRRRESSIANCIELLVEQCKQGCLQFYTVFENFQTKINCVTPW